MHEPSAGSHLARDPCLHPMDPMEMSCFDIRAAHAPAIPAPRRSQDTGAAKRKGTSSPPNLSLTSYTHGKGYWTASSPLLSKRSRLQPSHISRLDQQMHHSTCLNLNANVNCAESDFWILPDFDDWEEDNEPPQLDHCRTTKQNSWGPLVKRAVSSNRERLRRRLEGDGWSFVGGKYGEDDAALKEEAGLSASGQESVDEEFDVVVLPVAHSVVHVAC